MASARNTGSPSFSSFAGVMNSAKEKWDASGANEAMSRMTANIPEGTQEFLSVTSQQLFNSQKVRSVAMLIGTGEERPFYMERVPAVLVDRIKNNLQFFYLNYVILTGILFCLTLLITPSAIIGTVLLAALWVFVIRQTSEGSIRIKGVTITPTNATIAMSVFSAIALIWLFRTIFWWTLLSSGCIVAVHAALRDASLHHVEIQTDKLT